MTWRRLARAEKSKGSEGPGGSRKTTEDTGRPRRTQRDPGPGGLGSQAKKRQPADPGGTVMSQEKPGEARGARRTQDDPGGPKGNNEDPTKRTDTRSSRCNKN